MTQYTLESSREWYNNLPGKRASAAMIVQYQGKVLMVKDDYKHAMTFPGGIVDPDESPKTAAIRETREEVGLTLSQDDALFHSVAYIQEHNGFNDRLHFFFIAEATLDTVKALKFEDKIEYHKWVEPAQIGECAGGSLTYVELQAMLVSSETVPYFEV